ncbi:MAG: AAA family ATPase [Oscillospiraceae bacterium]|nr:AAA family ATPase [Oscillospiraceae bacterium]
MKIKRMKASFGCLEQAVLELGPGLNLLEAPNESGKSTWASFIRLMLYGLDTRDRDKKNYLADKNRYQPWSGAPMEGEMLVEAQGQDIILRRFLVKNTPFGGFSAQYAASGEPVPGMTGTNCGEMLLGVGREVFERSAFLGQGGVVTPAPELERRIAALVSTGQEDVSYTQTADQLREWLNRRQVNKSVGLIPKLEEELQETDGVLARLDGLTGQIARYEEERVRLEGQLRELEGDRQTHIRLKSRELNQRFGQAQQELDAAQAHWDRLERDRRRMGTIPPRETLKQAQGELQYLKALDDEIRRGEPALAGARQEQEQAEEQARDPYFGGLTGEQAVHKAQQELEKGQALETRQKRPRMMIFMFLLLGVFNLCQCIRERNLVFGIGALAVWTIALVLWTRVRKAALEQKTLLDSYKVEKLEDLLPLAENYKARWDILEEKMRQVDTVQRALDDHKRRRERGRAGLLDFVHTFAPEVSDLFGCSAALSRALGMEDRLREARDRLALTRRRRDDLVAQGAKEFDTLEELHTPDRTLPEVHLQIAETGRLLEEVKQKLNTALGEQKAVGDPAALAARREALQERLNARTMEHQAITMALEALESASRQMQERFSPALNRRTGELVHRLTGGRYEQVTLSRELEASALPTGGIVPRRALALSGGTADQIYFALRLAVCQLCLPEDDPAPLVLDDALLAFDGQRLEQALDLLLELAGERQILLLTCQDREGRILQNKEITKCDWING